MERYVKICIAIVLLNFLVFTRATNTDSQYSPQEVKAIKELRQLVEKDLQKDYQKLDAYLIHWLRAKNLNAPEAKDMILSSLAWRKANNIDGILEDKSIDIMRKNFPISSKIKDRFGRQVVTLHMASWDIRKGMLQGQGPLFVKYVSYLHELASRKIWESEEFRTGEVTQYLTILDMNGYNPRTHGCFACMPFYVELLKNYETHYPNMSYKTILINTGKSFDSLFKVIVPLMSDNLKKSVLVYSLDRNEWSGELENLISKENLQEVFGKHRIR